MNSETLGALAERIKKCAHIAGSGDALAQKAAIPRRTLETYLSGEAEPKTTRMVAIARAANVSVEWLATGEGEMKRAADNKPPVVNYGLLQAAELAVHLFLEQEEAIAPPGRIAKLVIALYKYGEAKGKLTEEDFHQFLQLVA